ncbi:MAG: molybdopterin molybdotransferase MoeA [Chitinophagaceae bacterium]
MILVEEAEKIILSQVKDFGTESIPFETSIRRVLAEELIADRDMPPFNRATLDGIAINFRSFEKGIRSFNIRATQAAGDIPVEINEGDECIEIMTGAALPATTDTVIGYEDLHIQNQNVTITSTSISKGQGIHARGKDKKQNEIVATANQLITPVLINMASSIGKTKLLVKKLPGVVIISSGNELVEVDETPSPYQIRRSNSYTVKAALEQYNLFADMLHIPDDLDITKHKLKDCLQSYDVIILSGGVSMGKFDYVPQALHELSVEKLFQKVQQRPGKPFWFGLHKNGVLVFALPGNPVSTFMCLYRYVLPWLRVSMKLPFSQNSYAILNEDFSFATSLQYFLQVKLNINNVGNLMATPVEGNSSGDFANLLDSDAFMELPLEQNNFAKGEVFKIWPFREMFLL